MEEETAAIVMPYIMKITSDIMKIEMKDLYNESNYKNFTDDMLNEAHMRLTNGDEILTITFNMVDKDYKLENLTEFEKDKDQVTWFFKHITKGFNKAHSINKTNACIKHPDLINNPLLKMWFEFDSENNVYYPTYMNLKNHLKKEVGHFLEEAFKENKHESDYDYMSRLLTNMGCLKEAEELRKAISNDKEINDIEERFINSKRISIRFKTEKI